MLYIMMMSKVTALFLSLLLRRDAVTAFSLPLSTTRSTAATSFDGNRVVSRQQRRRQANNAALSTSPLLAKKTGFGGAAAGAPQKKGFGANKPSANAAPPSKKVITKRIEKTYGGTTSQQIALATQQRIEKAMQQLPPHVQLALELHQQLQKWRQRTSTMTVLQHAQIPVQDWEGAQRAQEELQRLLQEHHLTVADLQNTMQQITWDASADAKAARSITGSMPTAIAARIDHASNLIAETVLSLSAGAANGRCLDVGCGFGVLVPSLTKKGRLAPHQIHGIDLSPEMIKNAQELHPNGPTFQAVDFLKEYGKEKNGNDDHDYFEAVVFCSSLHDMPDMDATLLKAWSLVKPGGGRLFILHAQGASHVAQQSRANPVLVPRGLPTAEEYQTLLAGKGATLIMEPAKTRDEEEKSGYLAVLEKS